MEGLGKMSNLDTINLCKNFIRKVEGLDKCKKLHSLLLGNNQLVTANDVRHILSCPELMTLDVQHNRIEDITILDVLSAMPDLRVLYLMGNPVVKSIRYYRKTIIAICPKLRYLDDRPVFEEERRRVARWKIVLDQTGDYDKALEAERQEIRLIREEKKALDERNFRAFEEMMRSSLKSDRCNLKNTEHDSAESHTPRTPSESIIADTNENPDLKAIRMKRLKKLLEEDGLEGPISTSKEPKCETAENTNTLIRKCDTSLSNCNFFASRDINDQSEVRTDSPIPGVSTIRKSLREVIEQEIWKLGDVDAIESSGLGIPEPILGPEEGIMSQKSIDGPERRETNFDELD